MTKKIGFPSPVKDTDLFKKISIRQTRKNRFRLVFRHDHRRYFIQKSPDGKSFTTYEEAYLAKNFLALDLKNGTFNPEEWSGKSPWRFDVAIGKWVERSPNDSEHKQNKKWLVDKFLKSYFKQKDFRTINDSDIARFYQHLKDLTYLDPHKQPKHYGAKRIKDIMATLKSFLASQRHHFKKFPDFPKIKLQLNEPDVLNEAQQDQIFEFISPEDRKVFTFLQYTGARPSEAGGMLRENVGKDYFKIATALIVGGKVRPTTKTKISRRLPIIEELKLCFEYESDSKFVFTTPQGRPYSTKMLAARWSEANKKAHEKYGTPVINLYNGLKHSFATIRLAQGFSLDQIQEVLGHTSPATTKLYAKFLTENLSGVMSGRAPGNLTLCSDLTTENHKAKRLGGKDSNLG